MKKTPSQKTNKVHEMSSEYRFDYKKAKPNRFVEKMKSEPVIVILDEDVAKVFTNAAEVNAALRALISAMPAKKKKAPVR